MNMLLKDSFEAASKINSISFGGISDEYNFVSFDVESLFTCSRLTTKILE